MRKHATKDNDQLIQNGLELVDRLKMTDQEGLVAKAVDGEKIPSDQDFKALEASNFKLNDQTSLVFYEKLVSDLNEKIQQLRELAGNGSIEAMNRLFNLHLIGVKEPLTGLVLLLPNISQALELIDWGVT